MHFILEEPLRTSVFNIKIITNSIKFVTLSSLGIHDNEHFDPKDQTDYSAEMTEANKGILMWSMRCKQISVRTLFQSSYVYNSFSSSVVMNSCTFWVSKITQISSPVGYFGVKSLSW